MRFFRHPPRSGSPPDDRATDEDVYYAYRLILNREPDPVGLADYRKRVTTGLTVRQLTESFFSSDEYRSTQRDLLRPTPVDLGGYRVCVQKIDVDCAEAILHSHQYEEHIRRAVREHLREGAVSDR